MIENMKTYYKGYYVDENMAVYNPQGEVVNFVDNLQEAKDFIDRCTNENK